MIKTNIKMRVTPEQCRRVQEICFKNNIGWFTTGKHISELDKEFLFIDFCITITNKDYFETEKNREEINADLFIKTNGTCNKLEETYLTKYTSQPKDLESALKKIENLHIALKKKVDKNKNQALEITKLLEQKKDLQEINDTQNEYIRQIESDITFKVEESKQLQKENSFVKSEHNKIIEKLNESRKETTILENIRYNLEKKVKEKDTIISYLESKLK